MEFNMIFLGDIFHNVKIDSDSLVIHWLGIVFRLIIGFLKYIYYNHENIIPEKKIPYKRVRWTKDTISPIPSREKIHKNLRKLDKQKNDQKNKEYTQLLGTNTEGRCSLPRRCKQ